MDEWSLYIECDKTNINLSVNPSNEWRLTVWMEHTWIYLLQAGWGSAKRIFAHCGFACDLHFLLLLLILFLLLPLSLLLLHFLLLLLLLDKLPIPIQPDWISLTLYIDFPMEYTSYHLSYGTCIRNRLYGRPVTQFLQHIMCIGSCNKNSV